MASREVRITAIGGGSGLSGLIRSLKPLENVSSETVRFRITAIVSVADDGGSIRRLRWETGCPAPGDIHWALLALADTSTPFGRLKAPSFGYRFAPSDDEFVDQSARNILLASLWQRYDQNIVAAVTETGRMLGVCDGSVLPATRESVQLHAVLHSGEVVSGESQIEKAARADRRIRRVWTVPD